MREGAQQGEHACVVSLSKSIVFCIARGQIGGLEGWAHLKSHENVELVCINTCWTTDGSS